MNGNCKKFETISVGALFQYVGKPDCVIVDLRDNAEYKRGHVDGAVNIPYDGYDIEKFKNISRDKEIIFYCDRGGVSTKAARELACIGYKTKTVVGGYNAVKAYNKISGASENKRY